MLGETSRGAAFQSGAASPTSLLLSQVGAFQRGAFQADAFDVGNSVDLEARLTGLYVPTVGPEASKQPVDEAEATFRALLQRAGFQEPEWHRDIHLGKPLGSTSPDCYFPGDDLDEPGVCVCLAGLSAHILGNPATRPQDRAFREQLRARHYWVFEIAASDLADRGPMARRFYALGQVLLAKDRARELRDQPTWFDRSEP